MSDPLAELRETFFLECDELLEKLETDLLALESGAEDDELVNSAFRAVHSIKGGAGAFGMSAITDCAHVFETAMDHVRAKTLELTPELCELFLRGKDLLAVLILAENGGPPADEVEIKAVADAFEAACPEEEEEDLSDIFKPVAVAMPGTEEEASDGPALDPMDILAQFESGGEEDEAETGAPKELVVVFAPKQEFYVRGNDPAPFIRELRDLGDAEIMCDISSIPPLDELSPSKPYFEWTVILDGATDEAQVEEIFEFVAEDCVLSIEKSLGLSGVGEADTKPPLADVFIDFTEEDEEPAAAEEAAPPAVDPLALLAEIEAGAKVPDAAEPAIDVPDDVKAPEVPADAPVLAAAQTPAAPQAAARKHAGPKPVVRVELSRVDRLINLVSELVISQSMLSQAVEDQNTGMENAAVVSGLDEFRQLTRELQESVMAIRAEPVRSMFMRMSQIVRSTAQACGKRVKLVTDGETTEVDKTVIERLTEPLTHMIRNAVDHGVESTEDRIKAGKDEQGMVRLTAEHHSGRVVISVIDDGGGINREKVRAKAIEKGIITADAQLTDSEIDLLLFAPGFSTAAEISQVSGRGVGMDVVKREINSLGGRISISSVPGQGTTFTISLPLTLAVLDGMVIRVAEQTVVLPLSVIAESLRPEPDEIQNLGGEGQVIFVRGSFVPILDVGAALGYRPMLDDYNGKVMLLVENDAGMNYAFAVDEIIDQRQVVIKGLQDNYGRIEGVAAATILGDGQIALILDVNDLSTEHAPLGAAIPLPHQVREAASV